MKKLINVLLIDEHATTIHVNYIGHCPTCDPAEIAPQVFRNAAERSLWNTKHTGSTNHMVYYKTEIKVYANGS